MSWRASLLNKALRSVNTPYGNGRDYPARRNFNKRLLQKFRPEKGVEVSEVQFGGVRCELLQVKNPTYTVFYIHGGSFCMGSIEEVRKFLSRYCKTYNCRAVSVDYRLAPENPFPAGLEDCYSAYTALCGQADCPPSQTVVMGESAGGNLAIALSLMLRDRGQKLPGAVVALSPVTELSSPLPSHIINSPHCILCHDIQREMRISYAAQTDSTHPYISPLYANLRGLPPMFVSATNREMLLDDSIWFVQNAKQQGADVALKIYKNIFHAFQVAWLLPESKKACKHIDDFIKKAISLY